MKGANGRDWTEELTDKAWMRIQPLLPASGKPGGCWSDYRMVINGILWQLRTGVPGGARPSSTAPGRPAMIAMCPGAGTATWDRFTGLVGQGQATNQTCEIEPPG